MAGVENPNVVDFVGYNEQTPIVTLAMVEERSWNGSEERLMQLQTKINSYLSFVLDGQFAQNYPEYKSKQLAFQLNCALPPDDRSLRFLNEVKGALSEYGIDWVVKVQSGQDRF